MMPGTSVNTNATATAESGHIGGPDSGNIDQAFRTDSSGNRGFQNNVAFPGSSQSIEQGINPPMGLPNVVGSFLPYLILGALFIAAIYVIRRKF